MHLFLASSKNGFADAHDNLAVLVKRQVAEWDKLMARAEAAEKDASELRTRAKRDEQKIQVLEKTLAPFRAQIERKAVDVLQRSWRTYKNGLVKVKFALKVSVVHKQTLLQTDNLLRQHGIPSINVLVVQFTAHIY